MVEVSLTVGKLDASLALLLTKDHHLIEFPTILLPNGVKAGSIVKISCERDLETETEEQRQFLAVQEEILATFGKNNPQAPLLKIKNVTQTSCVLEWDTLDLGTATLKSLTLFKDGKKLGAIPQPLSNRTTKLSGLPLEKNFKFQLKLDSTAGVYMSEVVEVKTHKMTDLSGIHVCLGDITPNEQFTVDDIQEALVNMRAHHPALDKMKVETTHYIATRENKQNSEFIKANEMNIPIIRPEWLKACEKERRIVGVREFYVKDCVLPDILARNYWLKPAPAVQLAVETESGVAEKPLPSTVPESDLETKSVAVPTSDETPAIEISAASPTEEKSAEAEEEVDIGEPAKDEVKEKTGAADVESVDVIATPVSENESKPESQVDPAEAEELIENGTTVVAESPSKDQDLSEPPVDVEADLSEKTSTTEETDLGASVATGAAALLESVAEPAAEEEEPKDVVEESAGAEKTAVAEKPQVKTGSLEDVSL